LQRGEFIALAADSTLRAAAAGVIKNEHALLGVLNPRAMLFKVSGTNQAEAAHSRLADALGRGTRLNLETAIHYLNSMRRLRRTTAKLKA